MILQKILILLAALLFANLLYSPLNTSALIMTTIPELYPICYLIGSFLSLALEVLFFWLGVLNGLVVATIVFVVCSGLASLLLTLFRKAHCSIGLGFLIKDSSSPYTVYFSRYLYLAISKYGFCQLQLYLVKHGDVNYGEALVAPPWISLFGIGLRCSATPFLQ
jgi:hypothetical protein